MYLSKISLNVNDLNAPIKRHMVAEWIRKQDPYKCCLQKTHSEQKTQTKSKRIKKDISCKWKGKNLGQQHLYLAN